MPSNINGAHFVDAATQLDAATLNKLNPPGALFWASGDGLDVSVRAAAWFTSGGTFHEYAGSTGNTLPASSTRWLYLDSSNALQISASAPTLAADNFILGRVTTNGTEVTEIVNVCLPSRSYTA